MRAALAASCGVGTITLAAATSALACVGQEGLESIHYAVRPAIVRIQTIGPAGCSTHGAGFFISPNGRIMTAKHVVPVECSGQTILAAYEGDLSGRPAQVVERSGLDIVVLKLKDEASNLPFLELDLETPEGALLDQKVIVSSFPRSYLHANYTAAKIDAVEQIDDDVHWMLCGPAVNPGRSGSPVITSDGLVAAVFVARPEDQSGPPQDIAKVVPIRRLLDISLDRPSGGVGAQVGKIPSPNSVAYAYPIRITLSSPPLPTASEGRTWVKRHGDGTGEFKPAGGISALQEFQLVAGGWELKFEEKYALKFAAFPGYRFDPAGINLVAESHNPPFGPRPDKPCAGTGEEYQDCYILSEDKRQITLRLRLWQGYIGNATRGWFGGELQTFQVRG